MTFRPYALARRRNSTNNKFIFIFYFPIHVVSKHIVVLPKSVTPSRILSNVVGTLNVLPKLSKEELERLDGVAASGKQTRYVPSPMGRSRTIDTLALLRPTFRTTLCENLRSSL